MEDPHLIPLDPDSLNKWYVTLDDQHSQLADKLAERAGLYDLIDERIDEALVVIEITAIIKKYAYDPAEGVRLRPWKQLEAEMFAHVNEYIDNYKRTYIQAQDRKIEEARKIEELINPPEPEPAPKASAAPPRRKRFLLHLHDYESLHTYMAYSRKLQQDVEVSLQRCHKCKAERQVVRKKGLFGMKTIRIRRVAPGTYT